MTDQPRLTPNPDGGFLLHLPDVTCIDTQVWSVDIGLTPEALDALRAVLAPNPGTGSTPVEEPEPLPEYMSVTWHRTDDGRPAWAWRCWGHGDCDGHLALDLASEQYARRNARRHVTEAHPEETP